MQKQLNIITVTASCMKFNQICLVVAGISWLWLFSGQLWLWTGCVWNQWESVTRDLHNILHQRFCTDDKFRENTFFSLTVSIVLSCEQPQLCLNLKQPYLRLNMTIMKLVFHYYMTLDANSALATQVFAHVTLMRPFCERELGFSFHENSLSEVDCIFLDLLHGPQ